MMEFVTRLTAYRIRQAALQGSFPRLISANFLVSHTSSLTNWTINTRTIPSKCLLSALSSSAPTAETCSTAVQANRMWS